MSLNGEILELLNKKGCNIVGFADLRCLAEESHKNFNYGILIALSFSKEAMKENNMGLPQRYYSEHESMNHILKDLKGIIVDFLNGKGYDAAVKTPSSIIDGETLRSQLPQKTIATLSGIGWIGKNAMLITDETGSALRLTVILTNAPLDCGVPVMNSKCPQNCTVCADVCPGKAPLGGLWEAGIDRDKFFNAYACRDAGRDRAKRLLNIDKMFCGLCISICPFTKKGLGYE